MKTKYRYRVNEKEIEREINYIPFRYILAIMITVVEVAAVIGIVFALCYYVPYFYLAAWATEIFCVIKIIASDDNPDYKVPWLLFVLIIPIAGFMLYFMFYSRTLQKKYIKRLNALKDMGYQREDTPLFAKLQKESPTAAAKAKMLCDIAECSLFADTKQTYFPLGGGYVSLPAGGPAPRRKVHLYGILHYRRGEILELDFGYPQTKGS